MKSIEKSNYVCIEINRIYEQLSQFKNANVIMYGKDTYITIYQSICFGAKGYTG